jgi:hypothetical protein
MCKSFKLIDTILVLAMSLSGAAGCAEQGADDSGEPENVITRGEPQVILAIRDVELQRT